jgi:thiosulfate dehydrogenase
MAAAALMACGTLFGQEPDTLAPGGLIPATTAMETAWDIPRNPLTDTALGRSYLADQIRRGFEIFLDSRGKAARFTGNDLSCGNCHLNAGQRDRALPMVGVAAAFPEYNKRQAVLISLEDRIVGCFLRSLNATGFLASGKAASLPTASSAEVLALSAYITWLSEGQPLRREVPWRGRNVIEKKRLLPIAALDARTGEALYLERCANCHGEDGQGIAIGDKKPGPLWGHRSWNDGAGAARVYTLAGMIRHDMPYLDPGSLSDEEAQHIALFINSKPRPAFPFKSKDYRAEPLPADAVYYRKSPNK